MSLFTTLGSPFTGPTANDARSSGPCIAVYIWALCTVLVYGSASLSAQPGQPGDVLLRYQSVEAAGLGGANSPWNVNSSALFSNVSSLARLSKRSIPMTWTPLPGTDQSMFQGSIGMNIGSVAGAAVGLQAFTVDGFSFRAANESEIGTGSSSDIALTVGGGLRLGPGSIGMSATYFSYALHGTVGSADGFSLGLSGGITFEERLHFGVDLNNIAGTVSSGVERPFHETIPPDVKLGASYRHPLESPRSITRSGPLGVEKAQDLPPRSYIMAVSEVRLPPFDEGVVGSLGVEFGGHIPISSFDLAGGFRGGVTSKGEFSAGLFVDFADLVEPALLFSVSLHQSPVIGALEMSLGLEFRL